MSDSDVESDEGIEDDVNDSESSESNDGVGELDDGVEEDRIPDFDQEDPLHLVMAMSSLPR